MDRHEVQGVAAKIVSQLLSYCIESGMTDELLHKHYPVQDADQIKEAIQDIANEHSKTADYHRSMGRAIRVKGGSEGTK